MKLKRELRLFDATIYGIGIILGAGIYALIGEAAGLAGNSLWLSFLFGAFVALFTGLSYAELSTMFPKVAAEYVYVRNAFGSRFLAFLAGWLLIAAGVIGASTVSLGFSGYFSDLLRTFLKIEIDGIYIAFILLCLLSLINFVGIRESARFNAFFTIVEVIGLLIIILVAIPFLGRVNYFEMPKGFGGVLSASVLVFFAYLGFENIANIAEETINPRKTLPKAFILAIFITTLIYILTSLSSISLANWKDLSLSKAPLAFAASKVFGNFAYLMISFIALFATANTVLIILITISRIVYGMARERSLPEILTLIHEKRKTPWTAIIAVWFLSAIFLLFGDIKIVAALTSLFALMVFVMVNFSLIWLRFAAKKFKRVFKVPLNIGNFPIIALLGILFCLLLISQVGFDLIFFGLLVTIMGAIVYFVLRRRLS